MTRWVISTIVTVLVASASASAHAPDEYVQRLRVDVTPEGLLLSLDMTPGAAIVNQVLERIDRDRDGVLSLEEAQAYGHAVLADLTSTLDGRAVPLSLARVELPMPADLRAGNAAIRVDAAIASTDVGGQHRLMLRNTHLPEISVYLANALQPASDDIRILRQVRDSRQQSYELDYELGDGRSAQLTWLLLAVVSIASLAGWRTRSAVRASASAVS